MAQCHLVLGIAHAQLNRYDKGTFHLKRCLDLAVMNGDEL
jgi:hypothetical protein